MRLENIQYQELEGLSVWDSSLLWSQVVSPDYGNVRESACSRDANILGEVPSVPGILYYQITMLS